VKELSFYLATEVRSWYRSCPVNRRVSLQEVLMLSPITLERAREQAQEYVDSAEEIAPLLVKVRTKAGRNYEHLLKAWESLHILVRMVREQVAGRYTSPVATTLSAVAALIYFVEPFDFIPDPVPVFGFLDDMTVISYVVRTNLTEISKFRKWECS